MSTTKRLPSALAALAMLAAVVAVGIFVASPKARADVPVFLTRLNQVITTYPNSNAFNVGSSTPQGGAAKLGVALNAGEAFVKAFEVASTSTAGGTATTTADLLKVTRNACYQLQATSTAGTATPIKVVFSTVSTSTASGYLLWSYGTCP